MAESGMCSRDHHAGLPLQTRAEFSQGPPGRGTLCAPFLPTSTGTMLVRSSVFLINYNHLSALAKFLLSPIQSVLHNISRLLSLKCNIILSLFLLNSLQQFLISSWIISKPKLKHQYFGHLMRRADSLEKTLMLGKIEGRRRKLKWSWSVESDSLRPHGL